MKKLVESKITIDPNICGGKPCIKGTRVTVADILLALTEGLDEKDILRNFRKIQKEDITAALAYAYCVADHITLNINKAGSKDTVVIENDLAKQAEIEEQAQKLFGASLEKQASIQEDITKEKLEEIRKQKEADNPSKTQAPSAREFDLEIDISGDKSTEVFSKKDNPEQGIDMRASNYIFEDRGDKTKWIIYSAKADSVIDKAMKRNIKLTYRAANGKRKQGIFEGYLTNDRLNKVFIERIKSTTMGSIM